VLRGRSARVRARVSGTAPGGSASSSTASAPRESGSGAERDLSRAFFCRNRGSFDDAGDDGDDISHVTVTRDGSQRLPPSIMNTSTGKRYTSPRSEKLYSSLKLINI
jgi:hypothetical protein